MRLGNAVSISLLTICGLIIPTGAGAADTSASLAPMEVSAANGPSAIRLSGGAPGGHQLIALLYASFAPDLPTVFLNRRSLATDAAGHFDAIVPIAPAFYPGAIITVIVQTTAAVVVARGSLIIADPNVLLPTHK